MESESVVQLAKKTRIHGGQRLHMLLPKMVARIIKEELWKAEKDRQRVPFKSFRAFVEHPLSEGLELPYEKLQQYCDDHEEATRLLKAANPQALALGDNQHSVGYDIVIPSVSGGKSGGNSPDYALRRLKRDRPDLAEKVIMGEMSAHAAAVEAGFRNKTVSVRADDAARAAKTLRKHYTLAELSAVWGAED